MRQVYTNERVIAELQLEDIETDVLKMTMDIDRIIEMARINAGHSPFFYKVVNAIKSAEQKWNKLEGISHVIPQRPQR